jgi:endoglucanase
LRAGRVNGNSGNGVLLSNGGGTGAVPVTLRGMSLFWSNTPEGRSYYNDHTVGWLVHDWRISVIRAAMGIHNQDGGGVAGYMDGDSSGSMQQMMRVIEAAIHRGIYVIVDWHMHCLQFSSPAFTAQQTEQRAIRFFTDIARMYGRYPNVLFEIWNEPVPNANSPPGASNCGNDWGTIRNYANNVVRAIRNHSDNVVIVGSQNWSSQPHNAVGNQVTDTRNNIAYSIHFYANSGAHQQPYRNNTTTALNAGLPVFATEFGSTNPDGDGPHNAHATTEWLDFMDQNHVGWSNWSVNHKNETSAALTRAATQPGDVWNLSASGAYIRGEISRRNASYFPTRTYAVNTTVAGNEGGAVVRRVGTTVNPGPYDFNTTVTITAEPAQGWEFDGWSGDASGPTPVITYRIVGLPAVDLTARFVRTSMITNGMFTHNTTGWAVSGAASPAFNAANGELNITLPAPGANSDAARVVQGGLSFQAGWEYRLTFRARGQAARPITVRITNSSRSLNYAEPREFALSPVMTGYEYVFTSERTDANGALSFNFGDNATAWFLDDVTLDTTGRRFSVSVQRPAAPHGRTTWTTVKAAGGVQLRGPADAGATVSLYDTRGRMVRTLRAADGMVVGSGLSAGNYLMVVRNSAGSEVLRTRVVMVR